MSILPRLVALFRESGYEPITGYNSFHFEGYRDAPFTRFVKDGVIVGCAGLALQEIMFLEHFSSYLSPKNILCIGNAQGWSTIALSLIFPSAAVAAIDPNRDGNALTNKIAAIAKLNVKACEGYSPQDVGSLCAGNLKGPADLILIDAVHTNEAVLADYAACKSVGHADTVYVFHDVINWRLTEAINQIKMDSGLNGKILTRTASGMAVLWRTASQEFNDYIDIFSESPAFFRLVRKFVLDTYTPSPNHALESM